MKLKDMDKLPFQLNNNGELVKGFIYTKDICECLKSEKKDWNYVKTFNGGMASMTAWNILKDLPIIKSYVREVLPEYLI